MQKEIWVVFGITSLKLENASLNNTEMLVSPWRTDKGKATDFMWDHEELIKEKSQMPCGEKCKKLEPAKEFWRRNDELCNRTSVQRTNKIIIKTMGTKMKINRN